MRARESQKKAQRARRRAIYLGWLNGATFSKLAKLYGVTRERIGQIVRKARNEMAEDYRRQR